MKAVLIYFGSLKYPKIKLYAESLAKGIREQNIYFDIIEGDSNIGKKITMYQYVVFFADSIKPVSLMKESPMVEFLKSAGPLSGKKSSVFTIPKLFNNWKRLINMMELLESEGLIVKNSDLINSEEKAFEIGQTLHINQSTTTCKEGGL